jgi:hypothetical protein
MIARLRVCGQEFWHHDVLHSSSDGLYLTLRLAAHPSMVHYYLAMTSVLLCATPEDVTAALREERS